MSFCCFAVVLTTQVGASTAAVDPSYSERLAIGNPTSSEINV